MSRQILTILVVEDHEDTRIMLRMFLKLLGHRCELAEDAGEAMIWATKGPFDALLTDVHMPGMGGFELVQILRDNERLPILVISMSAGVLNEEAARSKACGCHAHLLKPFQVRELAAALSLDPA